MCACVFVFTFVLKLVCVCVICKHNMARLSKIVKPESMQDVDQEFVSFLNIGRSYYRWKVLTHLPRDTAA